MKGIIKKRRKALILGMIIFLNLGFLYAWSNFVPHMEEDEGWSRTAIATAFTISMVAFSCSCVIGGAMAKKLGMTKVIRIGALLMAAGLIGAGMSQNLTVLYLMYGVVYSFGVGSTYIPSMSLVQLWFPDKIGTISGLLLFLYGMGGAILGTASAGLIGIFAWKATFKIMGIAIGAVVLLISCIIDTPSESEKVSLNELVKPAGDVKKSSGKAAKGDIIEKARDMTPKEMLRRKSFWLYFMWFSLGASLWLGAVGEATTFALDIGATAAMATLTSGIITCSNGLGRLITGWMYDHVSRRKIMMTLSTALLTASVLMLLSLHYEIIWLLMLSVGIIGLAYGGTATTNPVIIRRFYGDRNYSQNYGIVNFNGPVSAILGSTMGPVIYEHFGNYDIMMLYFAAIMLVAFILQCGIKKA